MTDNENALIAYAILDEVNGDIGNVSHDVLMRDIARAQVYATLATVQPRPTRDAVAAAVHGALERMGITVPAPETREVTDAVMGLL